MLKKIMGAKIGGFGVFREDGFNGLGAGPDLDNWAAKKIASSLVVRLSDEGVISVWDEVGGWDGVSLFYLSDPLLVEKVRSELGKRLEAFEAVGELVERVMVCCKK